MVQQNLKGKSYAYSYFNVAIVCRREWHTHLLQEILQQKFQNE